MIEKEKFDELQKKQDDLRLKRNNLADEQQKIQKQIDEIEIQKYDAERFVGKIIITKKMIGAVYVSTNYMIVDRVERLFKGPRFYGKSIEICFSNSASIGNSICMYERSEYSGIAWSGLDSIDDTTTPEQLKATINRLLNVFDYGNEVNKLKEKHGGSTVF